MDEVLEDQYESNTINTSSEESSESQKTDSSDESDSSSMSDNSDKSGKSKRKRAKKKGIFYDNLDMISLLFRFIDIYYFIIESRKRRKNIPKRRKLYMRVTEMDKNLREALRVTKNFVFNYFIIIKLINYNLYVSETFFGTFKDYQKNLTYVKHLKIRRSWW